MQEAEDSEHDREQVHTTAVVAVTFKDSGRGRGSNVHMQHDVNDPSSLHCHRAVGEGTGEKRVCKVGMYHSSRQISGLGRANRHTPHVQQETTYTHCRS